MINQKNILEQLYKNQIIKEILKNNKMKWKDKYF